MVALYSNEEGGFKNIATTALVKSLEDPNEVIKKKLLLFWSDPGRLSPNPSQRLLELMNYKSKFNNEKIWLQSTVWLLLDLIRFNNCENSNIGLNKNKHSKSRELDDMEVDEPKEESKSQTKKEGSQEGIQASQTEELFFQNTIHQASFGQTLELSSSLQNSRFYKSYQKDSFLMSMGNNQSQYTDMKGNSNLQSQGEKGKLTTMKSVNLDQKTVNKGGNMIPITDISKGNTRKLKSAFGRFFEKNQIMRPISTVGRNKNVRFGPDGVYRITQSKINEVKRRQQEKAENLRNKARKRIIAKNRENISSQISSSLEGKSNNEFSAIQNEDVLSPLQ